MEDTKVIFLIGKTGSGKSALGNVLLNKNDNFKSFKGVFEESSDSVSKTKRIQSKKFEIDKDKYLVIDTIGIDEVELWSNQELIEIAEVVSLVRKGIDQILFVNDGSFSQFEIDAYDSLRTDFDEDIIKYTTIVRTNFLAFEDETKCKEDIELMVKKNGRLAEIVKPYKERIIHVDNPSINIFTTSDENEEDKKYREKLISESKEKRDKSRRILLDHLKKVCQVVPYKPKKLIQLSKVTTEYLEERKELEEQKKKLGLESACVKADEKELTAEKRGEQVDSSRTIENEENGIEEKGLKKIEELQKKIQEIEKNIRDNHIPSIFASIRAQGWLNQYYPRKQRKHVKSLPVNQKNLQGALDLSNFMNLGKLNCQSNNLTSLNLSNCSELKKVHCSKNKLTNLILPRNCSNLKTLKLSNNNFKQNLSFLKDLVNLEELYLKGNHFYGSLEFLQKLSELEELDISDTDIDSGLEYLPDSLWEFKCSVNKKEKVKCQSIYDLFANEKGEVETNYNGSIKNFPQKLKECRKRVIEEKIYSSFKKKSSIPEKEIRQIIGKLIPCSEFFTYKNCQVWKKDSEILTLWKLIQLNGEKKKNLVEQLTSELNFVDNYDFFISHGEKIEQQLITKPTELELKEQSQGLFSELQTKPEKESQIKKLQDKKDKLIKRFDDIEEQKSSWKSLIFPKNDDVDSHEKIFRDVNNEYSNILCLYQELEKFNSQLREKVKKWETLFSQDQSSKLQQIGLENLIKLKQFAGQLTEKEEEKNKQLQKAKEEYNQLDQEQINWTTTLKNSLGKDRRGLEEQIKILQNSLEQARRQNNEFQVKSSISWLDLVKQLNQEKQELAGNFDKANKTIEETKQKFISSEQNLVDLEHKLKTKLGLSNSENWESEIDNLQSRPNWGDYDRLVVERDARPDISKEVFENDYKKRPTRDELEGVRNELIDCQIQQKQNADLLIAEKEVHKNVQTDLKKWTSQFPSKSAAEVRNDLVEAWQRRIEAENKQKAAEELFKNRAYKQTELLDVGLNEKKPQEVEKNAEMLNQTQQPQILQPTNLPPKK